MGVFSSCESSYPARTLTAQLTKLVKQEEGLDVTCHITGKTLWVYLPLKNLVDEKNVSWNADGLDTMNKVLSVVHRVILSTDAKLDFVGLIAADVRKFGIELEAIEYIPDVRQAIMEKFSRGEFFQRSIRDVSVNQDLVGDLTGEARSYTDISLDQFLALQIVHRVKTLFLKDKTLEKIFEIKSSSWSQKFGIIKIEFEFLKKKYDLPPQEEKIKPLDYAKMIAALVMRNYDYKNFQVIKITDTFSDETINLSPTDLKNIKIALPEFLD